MNIIIVINSVIIVMGFNSQQHSFLRILTIAGDFIVLISMLLAYVLFL
jgi:hypothetical protein